jgi:putative tryptophan/tyrosine transport system substrate-binding protein
MIARRILLGGGLATVLPRGTAFSQTPGRAKRIAVVASNPEQMTHFDAFRNALQERARGDATHQILLRFADGHPGGARGVIADVLAERPDVIVTVNTPTARAAIAAASETPVVMALVGSRVGEGVARSMPDRPLTGVTNLVAALAPKRLALLKEAAPAAHRVLALYHPDDPITEPQLRDLAAAAPSLGMELRSVALREPEELPALFDAARTWGADCVFRIAGQSGRTRHRMIELARERRLPSMFVFQEDARAGGLMAYYASFEEHWDRVAVLVDRILRGTPAKELPIEQPTRFELVLNLATARSIGLTLPPAFIARADEVIE